MQRVNQPTFSPADGNGHAFSKADAAATARVETWDDLITALEAVDGLDAMVALAKERRREGRDVIEFATQMVEVLEMDQRAHTLNEVFELSAAMGWNMWQPEMDVAHEVIKGGGDAEAALEAALAALARRHLELIARAEDGMDPESEWSKAKAAYDEAKTRNDQLRREYDLAWDHLNEQAPWPDELKDPAGGFFTTEGEITKHPTLSFDEKVAKVAALRAFLPDRHKVEEALHIDELAAASDASWEPRAETRERLLRTTPSNLPQLVDQFRLVLTEFYASTDEGEPDIDPENPEHIQELLSALHHSPGGRGLAQLYLNALRLAGIDSPALTAEPFDADAWLREFEAHPGHRFTERGPEYEEPAAWGIDAPLDEQLRITEPEALERFDAWVRARFSDEEWSARQADPMVWRRNGGPVQVGDPQHITAAYPDGGPEHDRLMAAWETRSRLWREAPTGAHLWRTLKPWQKKVVRSYVTSHRAAA